MNCRGVLPNALQRKTAEKTSNIAQKAAQEAKAASEAQNIAGQQAARQVLNYIIIYHFLKRWVSPEYRTTNRDVTRKYFIYNMFFSDIFQIRENLLTNLEN